VVLQRNGVEDQVLDGGWVARSSDSVQPVHSCAPIQITGGRSGLVSAVAILATACWLNLRLRPSRRTIS
jgi:hypothetical protein